MATIPYTRIALPETADYEGVNAFQWPNMTFTGSDVGQELAMSSSADRSVQVAGTLGVGGSVRIEGTIDGINWAPLTDPQGNDLAFTIYPAGYSTKIEAVCELVRLIRPRIAAGDGTTSLTVSILTRCK